MRLDFGPGEGHDCDRLLAVSTVGVERIASLIFPYGSCMERHAGGLRLTLLVQFHHNFSPTFGSNEGVLATLKS
jgi:hypothetical protein